MKLTDDELIAAYAGGSAEAFDTLYSRYRQRIYSYCFRSIGFDESQAADCCQEVWMRVIKAASSYRAEGRFDRWIFGLAHNCLVDRYRQGTYVPLSKSEVETPSLENFVRRFEQCEDLQLALLDLPLEQRSALLLHYCEGYSLAEIAKLQSSTKETTKSRLRYGINKMRLWMRDENA